MSQDRLLKIPQFGGLEATPEPETVPKSHSKKRKRGAQPGRAPIKVAKKTKSRRSSTIDDDDLDAARGINVVFSHMNNQLLADYVAQRTRKHEHDLSVVELEDRYIPATAIQNTTSWDRARDLNDLPAFLERFSNSPTRLTSASKDNGAPHTIIVAAAGLRAADIARSVRKLQTNDAKVAKLFAKHIKLKDAITSLKSTRTGIAVGTPIRLKDLINSGALVVHSLERIVIDASHIDQKQRGILEIKETQTALTTLLGHCLIRERLVAPVDGVRLLFY